MDISMDELQIWRGREKNWPENKVWIRLIPEEGEAACPCEYGNIKSGSIQYG